MGKLKLFEMFAGYGGASFGLQKADIDFQCVGYSEIDKYAIQCFEQNYRNIKDNFSINIHNYGDCRNIVVEELPDFDLLTGGFPCQSFSVAGKGLGEQDIRGTLFHDIIRVAEVKKPRYMLLENVKGLTFKNHKKTFEKILSELKRIGYYVKWKVLNSKEHGIPQNRERVWIVCFWNYPEFVEFEFPEKEELKIFLKDILEESVDEKYYLTEKQLKRLKIYLSKKKVINEDVMNCVGTCFGRGGSSDEECEMYARLNKSLFFSSTQKNNTIRNDGISNSLPSAMGMGGGHTPMILDIYNNKLKEDISITLTEPHNNNLRLLQNRKLRKLTPKECFRLMGFLDDNISLSGLSNTQKYKLAGNGWDINLVSKIFMEMLK